MSAFGSNTMIPSGNNNPKNPNNSKNSNQLPKEKRKDFNNPKRKNFHKSNTSNRNNNKKNISANGNSNGSIASHINKQKRKATENSHSTVNNEEEMVEDTLPEAKIIPKSGTNFQNFSAKEVSMTGPLIENPDKLGFRRKNTSKREIPKYLQVQSRVIHPIPFKQDEWDKANQQKMLQMEQANNGSDYQGIYEEFQRMRDIERKKMEDLGLVDAENIRKDLNDAISFSGTCLDMCPIHERVRRALENNVKTLEKDPNTNKISRDKAIKAFSRPAAGQPPPLPSEVRPPFVLVRTLDYIIDNIVPKMPEAHSFIWDRTRSIRQDFTYQNYYGPESIDCHERIVRIHMVSLHIMAGSEVEYSQQQELEQFNKALQTLMEIYQDVRNKGGKCPNEPEFRAYYLLSHLREPELERELQRLPDYIMEDRLVKLALRFRTLVSQNNLVERGYKNSIGGLNLFVEFFRLIFNDETPFLLACLLETQFNEVRFYSIKSMTRGYHTKGKPYDGEVLAAILGFDNTSQLIKFLNYYEIDVIYERGQSTNKSILVDLVNKEKLETKYKLNSLNDKPKLSQFYCQKLDKKVTKSLSQFINSGFSNDNLHLKTSNDTKILKSNKNIFSNNSPGISTNIPDITSNNNSEEVKAGSFADFMSRPSAKIGLGFSAQSNNKGNTTGFSEPNSAFGFSKPSVEVPMSRPEPAAVPAEEPKFSFGKAKEAEKPKFEFSKPNPSDQIEKPSFNFAPKPESSKPALQTSNFGPIQPVNKTSDLKLQKETLPIPSINSKTTFDISTPPKPHPQIPAPDLSITKATKKLHENKNFLSAAREVRDSIIGSAIEEELSNFLPKVIQYDNRLKGRVKIIDSLTKELYDAFLNELIYKFTLEIRADYFRQDHLKRLLIRRASVAGARLSEKHEFKRKRQSELDGIKFVKSGSLKRQLSNTSSNVSSKRRNWNHDVSIDEIVDRRSEIEKLWEPINFDRIIETCNANLKSKFVSNNTVSMTGLILVEDWKQNYSKWLNNKLSLKVNREQSIYERQVVSSDGKLAINFKSLPAKDYLNKQFFQDTSIIVFECGLLSQSKNYSDINTKLHRDGLILTKILQLVQRYGSYKLQVLVVYWDVTRKGLNEEEIRHKLNLTETKYQEVIKQITVCDMSQNDISEILNEGFEKMSHQFSGELTKRGEKIQNSSDKAPNSNTTKMPFTKPIAKISNDKFKAKEMKLINKAKMDKRYSYLNNHSLNMNNSMNQSMNQSINQQLNKSLFNQSFNQQFNRSMLNQSMNQSMNRSFNSSVNQTMDNSNILEGNASVLKFGNEIIEESTPFNSPRKVNLSAGKPVPNNLQQLIDLTSKVRSKYKPKK